MFLARLFSTSSAVSFRTATSATVAPAAAVARSARFAASTPASSAGARHTVEAAAASRLASKLPASSSSSSSSAAPAAASSSSDRHRQSSAASAASVTAAVAVSSSSSSSASAAPIIVRQGSRVVVLTSSSTGSGPPPPLSGGGPSAAAAVRLMPASMTGGTAGGLSRNGSFLYNGRPVKRLIEKLKQSAGRNNTGRITVRRRGGGASRYRRMIDFERRRLPDMPAVVRRIERDPTRTCYIALICYRNGTLSYILAADGLLPGAVVATTLETPQLQLGNCLPLSACPIGVSLFNVELRRGGGGQLARAAGAAVKVLKRYKDYTLLRLMSGEHRMVRSNCVATVGTASNPQHEHDRLRKAGQSRHLGRRPHVRGVAMNPVDHPHGGDTSGGRCSSTPWGRLTKGAKTRPPRRTNRFIVKSVREVKNSRRAELATAKQ